MSCPTRFLIVGLLLAALPAFAQEPQLRLYDQLNPPTPLSLSSSAVATNEEIAAVNDGDLGRQILLVRQPRAQLFHVYSQTETFYDSNILLLDKNRLSDGLVTESLGVTATPHLLDKLTSTVFLKYQLVRYFDHDELDFDGNTAGLSLSRPIGDLFTVYGGFQATRLYLDHGDDEFFKMFDTTFGLWRGQAIGSCAWVFYGYQLDWRASSPSEFDRVDNAGYVGVKIAPCEKSSIQLLYRIRGEEYLSVNRTDVNHLVSLIVTYDINDYVSLRASAEYGSNNSDRAGFDYDVFTGGGGLKLQIKF